MSKGKTLKSVRQEAELTQLGMANELGVSQQLVSAWECGTVVPTLRHLRKMAKVFGLQLDAAADLFKELAA